MDPTDHLARSTWGAVTVSFVPIASVEQALVLRHMRNALRYGFHDQRRVGPEQQIAWWRNLQPEHSIWFVETDGVRVGFLYLRPRPTGGRWITLGVMPSRQGQGIGREIYRAAPSLCAADVWAAIRPWNEPSLRSAAAAGYVEIGRTDDEVLMRSGI